MASKTVQRWAGGSILTAEAGPIQPNQIGTVRGLTGFRGKECRMARKVADVMWELLAKAGVKRCYGIVGDALNPVIDALRRNGKIEFIH